jgi:hypothetical protein
MSCAFFSRNFLVTKLHTSVTRFGLPGTKQRLPASYVLWRKKAYAWNIGAAISPQRCAK